MTADDYQALITNEHADRPLFVATLRTLVRGPVEQQAQIARLVSDFDVDGAAGVQLDAVGAWVGISRILSVALTDVYFTWDGPAPLGWDTGSWRGPFDPTSGLISLPDDAYRALIRAKIAANSWDGTLVAAARIWDEVFNGAQQIIVQDNQDMTMSVSFVGAPLSAVQQALLTGGYFPLKPEGVRILFYGVPVNPGPLFAWDTTTESLQGWDQGSWIQEFQPS